MIVDGVEWLRIIKFLTNIVFVSIPEEIFLVAFTLILLKKLDFLKPDIYGPNGLTDTSCRMQLTDVMTISIPILIVSIVTNLLRFMGVDINIVLILSIIVMSLSILFTYKLYTSAQNILITFLYSLLAFGIMIALEISYVPLIISATRTVDDINNSPVLNFAFSLPERVIEYSILAYLFSRKRSFVKVNTFKYILQSRPLTAMTLAMIIFSMVSLLIFGKLMIYDTILVNYEFGFQIVVIIAMLSFPLVAMSLFLGTIHYIADKEAKNKLLIREELDATICDLRVYANRGNSETINCMLDRLSNELEESAEKLYKKGEVTE